MENRKCYLQDQWLEHRIRLRGEEMRPMEVPNKDGVEEKGGVEG